jgi:hypothetical protein
MYAHIARGTHAAFCRYRIARLRRPRFGLRKILTESVGEAALDADIFVVPSKQLQPVVTSMSLIDGSRCMCLVLDFFRPNTLFQPPEQSYHHH